MQFNIETSEDDMQLYFKQNDVIKLSWLPQEVVPSYLTDDTENLKLKIELYQQYKDRDALNWKLVGNGLLISNTDNDGSEEVKITTWIGDWITAQTRTSSVLWHLKYPLSVVLS